ncbi:MAG: AzlC family ABC transporter permease [Segniliparus sp.]|uniref:AzlC family ABC transporter permease n=1 Tax=Segniliparus sp. TaxID=2804064 RepID=UPI003F2CCD2F
MNQDRVKEVAKGIYDIAPIALAAIPFGVLFGAVASVSNFNTQNTLLMSLLVYTGTMQMIGLHMISAGTHWLLILFASLVVNSRYLFYSAVLAPHLKSLSFWWRFALGYAMSDQIFILAERRYASRDSSTAKHWYMLTASFALLAVWILTTWIGFAFGNLFKQIQGVGLDFALCATYVALAAPLLVNPRTLIAGTSAGLLAVSLSDMPYQSGLFVSIAVGIAVGLIADRFLRDGRSGIVDEENP